MTEGNPAPGGPDNGREHAPRLVLIRPPDEVPNGHDAVRARAVRVLTAAGQPIVSIGLRAMLESEADMRVVGEASQGDEVVAMAQGVRPDVVLLDADFAVLDAVEITRRIVDDPARTAPRVMVLAADDSPEFLIAALRAGAAGFLPKHTSPADLVDAVRIVARGAALILPAARERLIEELAAQRPPHVPYAEQFDELTPREREVTALVARGLSNDEIAKHCSISRATVKTHVTQVLCKLHVRDRAQLVAVAYQAGLVHRCPTPRAAISPNHVRADGLSRVAVEDRS